MLKSVYFETLDQALSELENNKESLPAKVVSVTKEVTENLFRIGCPPKSYSWDEQDSLDKRGLFIVMPILSYGDSKLQASLDTDIFIGYNGTMQSIAKFDIGVLSVEELTYKIDNIYRSFKDKYRSYKSTINMNFKV